MEKKSIVSDVFYGLLGVFIIWATCFLLSGCGTTKRVESVKCPADAPGVVYGVGVGESYDYNSAKMFAENAARGEISRKISSKVKSFTSSYTSQHGTASGKKKNKDHYENINETYVATSADNTFPTTIVDHKVQRKGAVYIYYVCLGTNTRTAAEVTLAGKGIDLDNTTRATIISHREEFLEHMSR